MTNSFFRGANGILLAYDICQENTFDEVINWMKQIEAKAPAESKTVLLGCKCDKEETRIVDEEAGQEFADECKIPFYETSSLNGTNVVESFMKLVELCVESENFNSIESYGINKSTFNGDESETL